MKLFELQTPEEVQELERQLDNLMRPVGLDVAFTRHFMERLLGRERRVTMDEVLSSFSKLKKKYKQRLLGAKRVGKYDAVLKDFSNDLNIAFAIEGGNLVNITIMRKDPNRFGTDDYNSQELKV